MANVNRLKERMLRMAQIGKTENDGVTRLALSGEDKQARDLFIQWMEDLGLHVRYDDFGNIYGRLEGTNSNEPALVIGSHLDSVPKGGKFDGVLGVLAALEVVESLMENNIQNDRPIEIVSFTNEEGARFTPQMLGSGAVTNLFSKEYTYSRSDNESHTFKEELQKIGYLGSQDNRINPDDVDAFIEMHIEQGPVLETNNKTVGIVEGIAGFSWMEVVIAGETNHSGSTPMELRRDSLVTAASVIKAIHQWAHSRKDGTAATVGEIKTQPGIMNAIPGTTTFTLDVRHQHKDGFTSCIDEIREVIKETVHEESLTCDINEIKTHPPVTFAKSITNLLEEASKKHDISYHRMTSGAGHDAMYMNTVVDTAMLFVPSIGGKSHCEEENTQWEDIEKGITVLYDTVKRMSNVNQKQM
ncbi:Zn-dependent hydrolase [Lentibacillus cibarius]|uniref:Zn-dependent hydrolase n=1 Tax=Lentibacillus cibarius TaxID=2583219 RepID=A0A549YF81_9BACI|nr:Zn-dependent hydrolase [Lentibacillus cibarius]TRM10507.1 Zn-dependent hydrolase [Lentibacillus cibarius]